MLVVGLGDKCMETIFQCLGLLYVWIRSLVLQSNCEEDHNKCYSTSTLDFRRNLSVTLLFEILTSTRREEKPNRQTAYIIILGIILFVVCICQYDEMKYAYSKMVYPKRWQFSAKG